MGTRIMHKMDANGFNLCNEKPIGGPTDNWRLVTCKRCLAKRTQPRKKGRT